MQIIVTQGQQYINTRGQGNKKSPLGNDLLSQRVAPQVPSALVGLTAGFGMEPGVPPPLQSPRRPF
jgi:hypothetical protein